MNSFTLKIGLDYHGVIDKNPSYFAAFCAEARRRGHLIYIITGGPAVKIKQLLTKYNVEYDFIFAISDYYQALGKVEQSPDGDLIVPKHLWNMAKAEFCRRNHINFHIDDSVDYLHWFSTPFCLYDNSEDICRLSPEINLNFSLEPSEVVNCLEQTIKTMTCFL